MRKIGAILLYALVSVHITGCSGDMSQNPLVRWKISLKSDDKRPYGTYLAFQSLGYFFPGAKIETLAAGFRYSNMDSKMLYGRHSLLILEGLDFRLSEKEWNDLRVFMSNGNEVIVFCSTLDSKIEKDLKCKKELGGIEEYPVTYSESSGKNRSAYDYMPWRDNKTALTLAADTSIQYNYKGHFIHGYFSFNSDSAISDDSSHSEPDSLNTAGADSDIPYIDTIGYINGMPDVIKYEFGAGHFTLHAAPLVLSNYFLLQKTNENYLAGIWRTLPDSIDHVYWNEYYKRSGRASDTWVLWNYTATKLALLLAISTLLVYVLFEGKRKQRMIPEIAPYRNDSVSFVETVGRLYYNKGNHANLAEKMTQQFLEWVRIQYFLNTNLLNEEFTRQLIVKSGQPESVVSSLVEMIHEIRLGYQHIDEAYLYKLYTTIQLFYKK